MTAKKDLAWYFVFYLRENFGDNWYEILDEFPETICAQILYLFRHGIYSNCIQVISAVSADDTKFTASMYGLDYDHLHTLLRR